MHISHRLLILSLLCAVALPLSQLPLLRAEIADRGAVEEEFEEMLRRAQASYGRRATAKTLQKKSEAVAREAGERLARMAREKRAVRLRIVLVRRTLQEARNQRDSLQAEQGRWERLLREGKVHVGERMRLRPPARDTGSLVRHVIVLALGIGVPADLQGISQTSQREYLLSTLLQREALQARMDRRMAEVTAAEQTLRELEAEREEILAAYRAADEEYRSVDAGGDLLAAIKEEMERVHQDVLGLQSALARIDARLRARAERELLGRGLMDPRPSVPANGRAGTGTGAFGRPKAPVRFSWPVYGPITAGFQDAAYERRFGVPHFAADIAQPQGSPVSASADGVVFLVRDGGAKGYTYVLIGHRDGYATLYGHLSSVAVAAGDDVRQGQVIGLSGGQPGTPGAGLLTTGPHVHFEVITAGVNVDPITVLP